MNETIPVQLARLDIDRIKGYKELLDFYQGRQWEGRERRGERRLVFNYARVFIDKITSYLMSGMNFAVDAAEDSDEARARAQKAEAALNRVNVGGTGTPREFRLWGNERLKIFREGLKRLGRRQRVRTQQLFISKSD